MRFQYYPAKINSAKPLGDLSMDEFIMAVKNPNDKIKDIFKQIAVAELSGDTALKAELKQNNLYYFTPCVIFGNGAVKNGNKGNYISHRCYDNISSFTGLAVLDFDHIDNASDFKSYIFSKYDFITAAFLSSSKRGVKFFVKIPISKDVDDFKAYFYGLGHEFDKYNGFDGTAQNCVLPLFLSYDPDILFRKNASTFNKRGAKINAFKVTDTPEINFDIKDGDAKIIYKNMRKAFDSIINNGHPQVVAACVSLGGYVASGYITISDAEKLAEDLIKSNNYLQKGIAGYLRTSKTAIAKGMESGLIL